MKLLKQTYLSFIKYKAYCVDETENLILQTKYFFENQIGNNGKVDERNIGVDFLSQYSVCDLTTRIGTL